jgi:vacuolar-type H+-ATPase subunit C/Vma6
MDNSYPFIASYLKGEEMKLLTREHLNRMLATETVPEALRIIKDTDIGAFLEASQIKTFDNIDESLWRYLGDCTGRVDSFQFLPEHVRSMFEAYINKYDVFNIKATLMGIFFQQSIRLIPVGIIQKWGLSERLISAKNIIDIAELLTDCNLMEYAQVLSEYKTSAGLAGQRLLEMKLDNAYYKNLVNISRDSKDISVLPKAFGTMVDMANLKTICRAIIDGTRMQVLDYLLADCYLISEKTMREMLSQEMENLPRLLANTPYESMASNLFEHYKKVQNLTAVEEVLEVQKIHFLQQLLSPVTFVPALIIWYVVIKEIEMRNLRLALKAIIERVPPEKISGYLVFA